ncbi:MAG: hypothetical protein AAF530_01445 [Pseudomonadota bacterium]
MAIEAPYYPIIYVRGYAATRSEIEETVATPYMGFNLGATKVRQDYEGDIKRFIFESPLIRLMKDEGYQDAYKDGDFVRPGEKVPAKSVWIFRYYEQVSEDIGDGEKRTIPNFARDLRRFILKVRDHVCGKSAKARKNFKVYLVAHSMGGLICRCYLQNLCIHGLKAVYGEDPEDPKVPSAKDQAAEAKELELGKLPADQMVDKVFTYATPHNGIEVAGFNVGDFGRLDWLHVRNFNRDYMCEYLALPKGSENVSSLNGAFDPNRFFCLVGTNYRDYSAFFGLSKKGTGPLSDGLVMIKNAAVDKAPRAFVHRSHSGHYGIVNSEEGYQNLRRFLFGNIRVEIRLVVDQITLPEEVEAQVGEDRSRIKAAYYIESAAAIRGLGVFVNERRVTQESALRKKYEDLAHTQEPVYLFSGYLLKSAITNKPAKGGAKKKTTGSTQEGEKMAFRIDLGIQVPVYEIDKQFWFDEHFEGGQLFQETLTFHVLLKGKDTRVSYRLSSLNNNKNRPEEVVKLDWVNDEFWEFDVPIGFKQRTRDKPKPGFRGRLLVRAWPWGT